MLVDVAVASVAQRMVMWQFGLHAKNRPKKFGSSVYKLSSCRKFPHSLQVLCFEYLIAVIQVLVRGVKAHLQL
jgi:hypothetical protein